MTDSQKEVSLDRPLGELVRIMREQSLTVSQVQERLQDAVLSTSREEMVDKLSVPTPPSEYTGLMALPRPYERKCVVVVFDQVFIVDEGMLLKNAKDSVFSKQIGEDRSARIFHFPNRRKDIFADILAVLNEQQTKMWLFQIYQNGKLDALREELVYYGFFEMLRPIAVKTETILNGFSVACHNSFCPGMDTILGNHLYHPMTSRPYYDVLVDFGKSMVIPTGASLEQDKGSDDFIAILLAPKTSVDCRPELSWMKTLGQIRPNTVDLGVPDYDKYVIIGEISTELGGGRVTLEFNMCRVALATSTLRLVIIPTGVKRELKSPKFGMLKLKGMASLHI